MRREWRELSLTGRLCYLFMCIEKYLVTCYPDRDWTPVAQRCWQWTNVYWNEGLDTYEPVVPYYLLEFDNYEEANRREFDGNLPEKDYLILKKLFEGIADGSLEDEINQVLMLPTDFNHVCECSDFSSADEPTLEILQKMQQFLSLHNITAPDVNAVKHMTADQKGGWGDFVDSQYLAIILSV